MEKMIEKMDKIFEKKLTEKLTEIQHNIIFEVSAKIDAETASFKAKYEELEKENKSLKEEISMLKKIQSDHKGQTDDIQRKLIVNEQYSRRKSIRIFGVPEEEGESCHSIVQDIVKKNLKKDISPKEDIISTHRITSNITPRPIIVGFTTHDMKMEVMKRRKMLKGSNVVIAEDLCIELHQTLKNLRQHPDIQQTWSWDSKLYAKNKKGRFLK